MHSAAAHAFRLSRFGYLMGLYAENYQRLQRLFEVDLLEGDSFRSSIDDGLDLRVQVIERHAYTMELRMTYELLDPVTGEPDPSAYLRCYRDARVAEVTHCYIGRRWQDVLGLNAPARTVVGHRLRMNGFLSKWLEFLADQGHSRFTLAPDDSPLPDCVQPARVAIAGA